MNDDALKRLWQKQTPEAPAPLPPDEQIKRMKAKMKALDCVLRWSEALDLGDTTVMTPVFVGLVWYFLQPSPLARAGLVIMLANSVFGLWKQRRALPVSPPPTADAPMLQWLRHDLETVHAQREQARTAFWRSLPSWIGLNAFVWGLDIELFARIGCSVLFTAIYGSYWKLNQHTLRKRWSPLAEELESLLKSGTPE